MTRTGKSRTVTLMSAGHETFRVGDRAVYRFGPSDVPVEVIEERGPVGYQDERLVRVLMYLTDTEPVDITVREADLRRSAA